MSGIFDQIINYSPPLIVSGTVNYKGTWNASTNDPTLNSSPAASTKGDYYVVSTAGTQFSISFVTGDWIISNGTAWEKVDLTDAVSSVFGRTGAVVGVSTDYSAVGLTNTAIGAANPSTGAFTTISATTPIAVASGGTGVTTSTGTGSVVLSNTPTLVTPVLGAASATSITNGLGAVGTPSYTFTGDLNTGIYSPAADTLAFSEGGVEAMRITSAGNVGIGTTSPIAKFEINGNATFDSKTITIGNLTSDSNERLRIYYDGTLARAKLSALSGVSLGFGTNGIENRVVLDTNGNVGIGTTTPTAKLDVNGNVAVTGTVTVNAISGINALAAGTQLATFESSVNGAVAELITKGKNSVGTARQANIGINRFADDVLSFSNGTTEMLRLHLTTQAATFTGTLSATGNTTIGSSGSTPGGFGQWVSVRGGSNGAIIVGRTTASNDALEIGWTTSAASLTTYTNVPINLNVNNATVGAFSSTGLAITGALSSTGALAIGNTVAAAVAVASTHKVTIVIGGVTYYLLATNV